MKRLLFVHLELVEVLMRIARGLAPWYFVFCLVATTCVAAPFRVLGRGTPEDSPGDVRVSAGQAAPRLVFACDGSTADVERVLSQPNVISDLKALGAGVALALPDLSAERAQLVQRLNRADIPVTAWLALPPEQGYYLNASNARQATTRFSDFEKWSAAYGLQWTSVGLDIEPNIQEFDALRKGGRWRLAWTMLKRYFEVARVRRARASYAALVREIQAHGYLAETYQFPFIADQRKEHSTLLERLAGIVDVRSGREVLMLYTSFNASLDSALIWVYGPDAQAIAIGSTSGSAVGTRFVPLNWESFSRALLVAHHFSQIIGVYSLQGCIQQGFLHRLLTFDWEQSAVIPAASLRKATQFRARVQGIIWIVFHLFYFVALILLAVAVLIALWWRTRRRRRRLLIPNDRLTGYGKS